MSRPSFKRYFSLNDQDEYKRRICTVDDNDDNEANERDETVGTSENELCTLNEVDNNVIYERTERPGRQLKRYYSVNGEHQYDNGISDHDSPSDENITIEERENIFGKSESTSQPTKFNKLSVCRRWKRHIIAVFVILVITTVVAIVIRVHVNRKSNSNSNDYHKDGGQDKLQYPKGPEIKDQCLLYEEPGDYDLQSNPFRERCQNGSKFVTEYCGLNGSVSKHDCLECLHGDLLPNFCFCDVGHQCGRVDAPMKQTCSWCKNNCPCLNDGNCSCVHPNTTGEHIRCSCPTGYGGRYCEVVLVRLCKTTLKSKDLAHCAVSLYEECYIISGIGKSYMTCKIYTGSWCKNNCPCLGKGECSCVNPNTTGEHIRCSCPTGYGGRYCEVVPVRLCKTTLKSKDLAHCAESLYEECYIISGIRKSYMTCKIYTGDSVGTSIPNCTEVTKPR